MVATVNVEEGNTATPTWTVITAGRFATMDSYNPGSSNPCVVPSSGYNFSFWKHHRIAFSGTFTQISNVRWFGDTVDWLLGSAGTSLDGYAGGLVYVGKRDTGDHGCPTASYQVAAGTVGTTGYRLKVATDGHAYYNGQTANPQKVDELTSGSPLTVDTSTYTAAGSSKGVLLQVRLSTDATQGDKADRTFTFRYDEI